MIQGDGNIRYYELSAEKPYMNFLTEYRSLLPQRGLGETHVCPGHQVLIHSLMKTPECLLTSDPNPGVMPKRGLDVNACEVFRFYRLIAIKDLVEPVSMIVPRKEVRVPTTHCNLCTEGHDSSFLSSVFPVRHLPRGPVPTDSWKPGGHDGSGVAVGSQQRSVSAEPENQHV